MAVALNFDIFQDENNSVLIFQDLTGAYSASNTGGWGAPNELLSSVTSWSISITKPSSSTAIVITNPVGLPSSSNFEYEITATVLGYTTSNIEDGIWEVEYEVVTNTTTYRKTLRFCLYGNVECCKQRMALQLKPNCCCDSQYVTNLLAVQAMFLSMVANADMNNETAFSNWLTRLEKICAFTNCNCY